jgi:succinoglycan biosynthesis protein ExoM
MTIEPPAVSVVICTFDRLQLLQETVASCLKDASRRGLPFEVVIADNSPSGHARTLALELAAHGAPVRWIEAAPPNISVARNAGLSAARGELVAFLDDDLVVEPGWLDHLVDTLERAGADVAVGPVRPRFAAGSAPDWDPAGGRFTRSLDLPSGSLIRAGGKRKPDGFAISTASSLWRRATCFSDPEPFDPAFGASGGEDLDLFLRLERRDRRFVWCAEAGVWEMIPASRTGIRYQAMRSYSGGQVFVGATIRYTDAQLYNAVNHMARGAIQVLVSSAFLLLDFALWRVHRATRRQRLVRHFLNAASAAGKFFWWRKIPLYHLERLFSRRLLGGGLPVE